MSILIFVNISKWDVSSERPASYVSGQPTTRAASSTSERSARPARDQLKPASGRHDQRAASTTSERPAQPASGQLDQRAAGAAS